MRELHGGSPGNLEALAEPVGRRSACCAEARARTGRKPHRGRGPDRGDAALGISEFILSGYPHLEEAYWFGEGVLPILRQRGRWQHPAPGSADDSVNTTPFAPTSGPASPAAVS